MLTTPSALLATFLLSSPGFPGRAERVLRPGNVPSAVRGRVPLGPADPDRAMGRMILAFRLRPEARGRLDQLLADLHDPGSPRYHAWLTPEEFARAFGPGPGEVARVTSWLEGQGLRVDQLSRGGMSLQFSGPVRAVQRAFATPIQRFSVEGREIHANGTDPSLPAELAEAVEGVASLSDIPRRPAHTGARSLSLPEYTLNGSHYLAPGDFAAIYNLAPLHGAGIDGTGVSIAIAGRSNPGTTDVAAFRSAFGLPAGHTTILLDGADPGSVSSTEATEANLDMQWAGAAAPGASILFVCAASTSASDGVDLASQYAVDNNLAPVLSVSFGSCESAMGATELAFYQNLWAQAAAQGMTVCVASGDAGAAGCNGGGDAQGSGTAVSGLASSSANVCVGGTLLDDGSGSWWSAQNGTRGLSALGYIPETAWNESGTQAGGTGLWATGGGISRVVARPSWQAGPGVPAGKLRAVPDVALAAGSHDGYLLRTGGSLVVVGGTSAASPAFAGIMALLVQKSGQRQGNANTLLYPLASAQAQGGAAVFHDIVTGDNSVPGTPGYTAGTGYDPVTGLGSVDAATLINALAGLLVTPARITGTQDLGAAYAQTFTASGGTAPFTFTLTAGQLPPGLTLSASGLLTGTPTAEGTSTFTVTATDALGATGVAYGALQVGPVAVSLGHAVSGQLAGLEATYAATVTGALDTGVDWTASGGTLTATGAGGATFSAAVPGVYVLTATSRANPLRSASLQVQVHDGSFVDSPLDGLDALYLAGQMGTGSPGADLNGDSRVDAQDLAVLLAAMGW